jgi:hypothetical protein
MGRRSGKRIALLSALMLGGAWLLFEGLVRAVLFHGWFTAWEPIADLRDPLSFAGYREDEFHELRALLASPEAPVAPPNWNPELGWLPPGVGESFSHKRRLELGGERPVLLFGDSFAACVVPKEAFQVLFEETPLGAHMELVNYGCGGYGLDQIQRLVERALPLWPAYDPVVLVGLLVDDDLDRCRLSIHPWPKPRYRLEGDALVLEREVVPTMDEHMAEAFPLAKSWAWRLVLHTLLPDQLGEELCGAVAADLEVRPLCTRLLEEIIADLRQHRLSFGFVLFHGLATVEQPEVLGWREELVLEVLDRERVPYVLTRERLARHMASSGLPDEHYFYLTGKLQNHLTTLGNRVVLEDIVELVEVLTAGAGAYAPPPEVISLASFEASVLPDERSEAHFLKTRRLLVLRAGRAAPTEVRYAIGAATRLRFDAWVAPRAEGDAPGAEDQPGGREASGELRVLVDGREVAAVHLERGAPPRPVELEVAGAEAVVLQLTNSGQSPWLLVYLDDGVLR